MIDADRPLRIAHLAFSALPKTIGGLEIVVDNLIRRQSAAGHQPVLVTRWKQASAAKGAGLPYPVLTLPPNPNSGADPFRQVGPRWPTALSVGWHQLRERFDVWHSHWIYPAGWMAQGVLEAARVPLILTAHGADIETDVESGHGYRLFERNERRVRDVLSRGRYLTAISASVEARYREAGVPMDKITRISNGVDFARFQSLQVNRRAVRERYGLPADATIILTVGSDRPAKGHRFIPAALSRLLARDHDVIWVVLGGNLGAMDPLARMAGVGDRLRVIPTIGGGAASGAVPGDDVVAIYRAADIFAMPSLSEGFGMAALEAMAAGLPVVASDVSGLRSFVIGGKNGLLVPPGDSEALAAVVEDLLNAPQRRAQLSAAGIETARAYDWAQISDQYVALYRRAIAEAAR